MNLKNNNRNKINDIIRDAYITIKNVRTILFKIDKISLKNIAINDKLIIVVNKFEILNKIFINNIIVYNLNTKNIIILKNKFNIFEKKFKKYINS